MTSCLGRWNTAARLAGFNSDNKPADSLNESYSRFDKHTFT